MNIERNPHLRSLVGALILGMVLVTGGCGDSITNPGDTGMVDAYMSDQPAGSQASSHFGPSYSLLGGSSGQYSGSMSAEARVAISADGHTWIDLGPPSSASVQLQASGEGAEIHGSAQVPVGTYTRVRLVLEGANATLSAGSTIGGITLSANVNMTLGTNGSVTIEKSVPPFEVRADTRTRITWDLRSHLWVNEENAEEEEVREEDVQDAAEPRTQSGPEGDNEMV
jgi:hypothetical protein